ncbi:DsbE family thiol:disulfide interchange protein [Thioalkalivibrio sp. XN8]|uniref:DsbE family thiol:disulfide interchange protein n=1 Tax=Thioalkalivibrio sp. XN8 TaxID=2712863 RepID=UPI0013EC13A3|nr:DsbE family thiol:disulfide interchange protein [Thioalkalivibrio sp. XN8]NGP54703.1 DsbE family thiol:disulfide interchange protein [Thioalkalivibrio sp. XN8]
MKTLKYLLPVIAFVVLAGFFYKGLFLDPRTVPSPLIGKPAPQFQLQDLRQPEATFAQSDMLGRPAVLNVWATWCSGCRQEHPFLMQLARSSGVPLYGMNYRDERDKALDWLRRLGDPYERVAFDPDGMVSLDWGVYGSPETFLIDPAGTIVYKHLGPMTPGVWQEEFLPRIAQMQGARP